MVSLVSDKEHAAPGLAVPKVGISSLYTSKFPLITWRAPLARIERHWACGVQVYSDVAHLLFNLKSPRQQVIHQGEYENQAT